MTGVLEYWSVGNRQKPKFNAPGKVNCGRKACHGPGFFLAMILKNGLKCMLLGRAVRASDFEGIFWVTFA